MARGRAVTTLCRGRPDWPIVVIRCQEKIPALPENPGSPVMVLAAVKYCSVSATIDGKTHCFGNEDAKTIFIKDPQGNLAKAQVYYSSKH